MWKENSSCADGCVSAHHRCSFTAALPHEFAPWGVWTMFLHTEQKKPFCFGDRLFVVLVVLRFLVILLLQLFSGARIIGMSHYTWSQRNIFKTKLVYFFFLKKMILCVWVYFWCVYKCTLCILVLKVRKQHWIPGTVVSCSEPPCQCWKLNLVLCKSYKHL